MPCPFHIGETKINELNVVLFTKTEKLVDTVYEFTHAKLLKIIIVIDSIAKVGTMWRI